MSYNTVNQFLSSSLCSGSFSNVPSTNISIELEVACNMIDAALRPHHTLPILTGSVPSMIFDAERTIAAYRLIGQMGLDPGAQYGFLKDRYVEIVGDPVNPASGMLGMLRYGKILLVNDVDQDPSAPKAVVRVFGHRPRGWQQGGGRDVE